MNLFAEKKIMDWRIDLWLLRGAGARGKMWGGPRVKAERGKRQPELQEWQSVPREREELSEPMRQGTWKIGPEVLIHISQVF